jgi:hypothetical protein
MISAQVSSREPGNWASAFDYDTSKPNNRPPPAWRYKTLACLDRSRKALAEMQSQTLTATVWLTPAISRGSVSKRATIIRTFMGPEYLHAIMSAWFRIQIARYGCSTSHKIRRRAFFQQPH